MAIKTRSTAGKASMADGWEDAPSEFVRRVVHMCIYGDTGTGRTRLALTAPGPLALAHAAEKIDGLVQQFKNGTVPGFEPKDIKLLNFGCVLTGDADEIKQQAMPVWKRLHDNWLNAWGWARGLIMDTGTEGWELLRLSRFGSVTPKGRTENLYGPVNAEWRSIVKRFRQQDSCNLMMIHQTKEEYVDRIRNGQKQSERTGETIMLGMKEMKFLADVVIRTSRNKAGDFEATIEKGWFNAASEGLVLTNEDIRFANIMSIITGLDESEWS